MDLLNKCNKCLIKLTDENTGWKHEDIKYCAKCTKILNLGNLNPLKTTYKSNMTRGGNAYKYVKVNNIIIKKRKTGLN